jgi:uncharacterized protein with von Willebrand factor type A (vWA) domain
MADLEDSSTPRETDAKPAFETTPGMRLLDQFEGSKLLPNIMHFGRILRSAGLPVGPGKIIDAVSAVEAVGITSRRDFYWSLHAVFVNRRDQHEIFDQAFHIFWRDPRLLERMLGILMPEIPGEEQQEPQEPPSRRIMEAMAPKEKENQQDQEEKEPEVEVEATLTASANELLQKMDFEICRRLKSTPPRPRSRACISASIKFQCAGLSVATGSTGSICGPPCARPCAPAAD